MQRLVVPVLLATATVVTACADGDPRADSSTPSTSAVATTADSAAVSTDAPTTTPPSSTSATTPGTTATSTTATSTTVAPATTEAPTTVLEAAAWQPIGSGEFQVGVATMTVDDPTGERPLTVDVWFPLADDVDVAQLTPQQYTLLPGVYYESPTAFAATGEQIATSGPFPLVAYSHGSGGIRYLHSSYTEALASHGYVVVAPDHTGNTVTDRLAGGGTSSDVTAFNRPTDIRRVIDAFVDPSHPSAGPFAAVVDAESIAVTGHSLGGYTAIAMAAGVTTSEGEIAADERVDAIISLAPAVGTTLLPNERLGLLDVPMMVIVGTDDITTPVDPNVTRLWDETTNSPAYRIELVAGEHQTFTDLCAYGEFIPTLAAVPELIITTIEDYGIEGCSEGDIAPDRAAAITNTYAIEFLDQMFRDGEPIDAGVVVPPDDVIFDAR